MWIAFINVVLLGTTMIILGLTDSEIADRINEMSGFLGLFFGGLFAIIAGYFGVGVIENTSPVVYGYNGNPMGGQYSPYNIADVRQMHGPYAGPPTGYASGNPFQDTRGFQTGDPGYGVPPSA